MCRQYQYQYLKRQYRNYWPRKKLIEQEHALYYHYKAWGERTFLCCGVATAHNAEISTFLVKVDI